MSEDSKCGTCFYYKLLISTIFVCSNEKSVHYDTEITKNMIACNCYKKGGVSGKLVFRESVDDNKNYIHFL